MTGVTLAQALFFPMLVLTLVIGSPFGTALVAKWIVGPVDDAARARSAPARFYMIDALAFITLLQVAIVFPTWAMREGMSELAWPIGLLITFAAAAFWWGAIRALSRAGVHQSLRRAVFVLIVLPAAGIGNFVIAGLALACMNRSGDLRWAECVGLCVAMIAVIVALVCARRLTFWVLADRVVTDDSQ